MTIPEQIKKYRKEKEMTQKDLANAIGVTQGAAQYIYKMEKGLQNPSLKVLQKLAAVLECRFIIEP